MTGTADSAGLLLVVAAPSGAGKTSLVRALLETDPKVRVAVSHTTRPIRPGEADGVNYHFVDLPDFERLIAEDAFVEHAEVFGNRYGTSKAALASSLAGGQDVVLEIDWQGARQVRTAFPDTVASIFILPPSLATLKQRLTGRGQDAPAVIEARMAKAVAEISHYADFDYLVVNDDFDTAAAELASIVRAERLRRPRQGARHEALLNSLLNANAGA
ncbi:MAG: guanylate kinase [Pseudomonadota bacterium]